MKNVKHERAMRIPVGMTMIFPTQPGQYVSVHVAEADPYGATVVVEWTEGDGPSDMDLCRRDVTPLYARSTN